VDVTGRDDAADWARLETALQTLTISDDQRDTMYRLLGAILHLGNVYYKRVDVGDGQMQVCPTVPSTWYSHVDANRQRSMCVLGGAVVANRSSNAC
jgi:hypothetical protein